MSHDLNRKTVTAEDLAALYEEHGPGLSEAEMSREAEPLGSIEVAPQAFQFRDPLHRPWDKSYHVRKLVKALERQEGLFDPLLLFSVAGHRLVLDGHCRLTAYSKADLSQTTLVPVQYFRGSFSEALVCPALRNSKEKLPLTQIERLEAAWRLVLFDETGDEYSLRYIEEVTGAGKSTAGNMRKVLRGEVELEDDPRRMTWREVKQGFREQREIDPDWQDKRSNAWARRIRKQLGDKPNDDPSSLFEALEKGYPQLFPQAIPFHWAEGSGALGEVLEMREGGYDF